MKTDRTKPFLIVGPIQGNRLFLQSAHILSHCTLPETTICYWQTFLISWVCMIVSMLHHSTTVTTENCQAVSRTRKVEMVTA